MKVKNILAFAAIIFILGLLAVNYNSNSNTSDGNYTFKKLTSDSIKLSDVSFCLII